MAKFCPARKKLAFSFCFFFVFFSSDIGLRSPVTVSFLFSLLLVQTRMLIKIKKNPKEKTRKSYFKVKTLSLELKT